LQIKNLEFNFKLDNIYFRNCEYEDITQVIYVNRRTLPENYSRYTFLSMLRLYKDLFFVAVDVEKDAVIGYIMNKLDEGRSLFRKEEGVILKGHVFSVGVLHEYRRRGIASALLALGFKAMMSRGVKEIFLEVRVSNIPAIKLYEKFRMKIVDELPKYYADGENAYVMAVRVEDCEDIVDEIVDYLVKNGKIISGEENGI